MGSRRTIKTNIYSQIPTSKFTRPTSIVIVRTDKHPVECHGCTQGVIYPPIAKIELTNSTTDVEYDANVVNVIMWS